MFAVPVALQFDQKLSRKHCTCTLWSISQDPQPLPHANSEQCYFAVQFASPPIRILTVLYWLYLPIFILTMATTVLSIIFTVAFPGYYRLSIVT